MYQVNPKQLINMIKSGQNPQQLMLNILEKNTQGNPFYQNLVSLAKENKTNDIEQVARNLFKSQGRDFDEEFNSFRQQTGL